METLRKLGFYRTEIIRAGFAHQEFSKVFDSAAAVANCTEKDYQVLDGGTLAFWDESLRVLREGGSAYWRRVLDCGQTAAAVKALAKDTAVLVAGTPAASVQGGAHPHSVVLPDADPADLKSVRLGLYGYAGGLASADPAAIKHPPRATGVGKCFYAGLCSRDDVCFVFTIALALKPAPNPGAATLCGGALARRTM